MLDTIVSLSLSATFLIPADQIANVKIKDQAPNS